MKLFGDRLREARVAAGMTQEQLGFELGVSKSAVSAWENGRETPSFRSLPELRRQLRRSLDELICGVQPTEASPERTMRDISDDASPTARNEKERALLQRYRGLPARQRAALLELITPME
ncbi:MAG: helix-turn-helix transcriptional regulator [Thermomonas sp.]|uniref:helix-turn-helix domain-containing protein n=1 Tax=Thermomonas sp. TaxID=1971895 RepID=UPI0039E5F070